MKNSSWIPFFLLCFVALLSFQSNSTISSQTTQPAKKINHISFDILLKANVSSEGRVNYLGFKNNQQFQAYLKALTEANPFGTNWTKNDQLAFWINAYNAFTIQLITEHLPLKSIRTIDQPWEKKRFKVNGQAYSLSDIEHEILRKKEEPRIHFAIVCASKSCPKLLNEAYDPARLEEQLLGQAKNFINDVNRNKIAKDKAELSQIFNWFKSDFTSNGDLASYINKYSKVQINSTTKISYLEYDWSLND